MRHPLGECCFPKHLNLQLANDDVTQNNNIIKNIYLPTALAASLLVALSSAAQSATEEFKEKVRMTAKPIKVALAFF